MTDIIYLGTEGELTEELRRTGMGVTVCDSIGSVVGGLGGTDGVVVEYDIVGGGFGDLLRDVRSEAPDTTVVVVGNDTPDTTGYDGEGVFDFVGLGIETEHVAAEIRGVVEDKTQVAYPVPDREEVRAEEAAKYADADANFDRLTRIARTCFDSEVAFVGLVKHDEEKFLSCQGAEMDRIPRQDSVCTFQILDDGELVIEDINEDARFDENDTLRELGLRSYAGAPLITPSGARIGSFCVMDTEPRRYTEKDRKMLRLLAEEATEKLLRQEEDT